MTSAAFTINSTTVPQSNGDAVETSSGGTVSLAVTDTTGANSIVWDVVGTSDPDVAAPTITTAGVPDGATATFIMPGEPSLSMGSAVGVRCRVEDDAGNTYDHHGVVGVPNNASLVPLCAGEKTWRHATHGWLKQVNSSLLTLTNTQLLPISESSWVAVDSGSNGTPTTIDTYAVGLADQEFVDLGVRLWYCEAADPSSVRKGAADVTIARDGATYYLRNNDNHLATSPIDVDVDGETLRITQSSGTVTVALLQDGATVRKAKVRVNKIDTHDTVPST